MRISIIAAIGQNRELGKDNKLLWNISEDLKHFHAITMGHAMIMGRKTFDSIGRILSGRLNIVLSRSGSRIENSRNCLFVNSLEQTLALAKDYEEKNPEDEREIFIIGGGQVFKEALSLVDRLYLTIVHQTFPNADTFFPQYPRFTKVIQKEDHQSVGFSYTFLTLDRPAAP